MNNGGLTKENLLFTFPVGLRENQPIATLGDVTADALAKRPAEIGLLSIYARIDELPEDLLDILANDFKIDWWDPNYSLEEKRRTFKDSWYVHKHLGTKAAVETAISAIYPNTTVEEWFEYGGEPYHFQLRINISDDDVDSKRMRRVLERMNFYKSLRSHNDGIHYFMEPETMTVYVWMGCPGLNETMETAVNVPKLTPPVGEARADVAAGVVGEKAQMSAEIDMSAEIPGSEIKTRVGAVEYGENTVMSASLELHTEILGSMGGVQTAAAGKGMRVCMASDLDLSRDMPRSTAHTGASAGACGWGMGMEVAIDLRKTEYPGGTSAARAVGKAAGIYQKLVTEVSAHETLG